MAKQVIQEKYSLNAVGILNIDNMTIEGEYGIKDLKKLLAKIDGEEVKISISKVEELE